jgi:hypothetical protein
VPPGTEIILPTIRGWSLGFGNTTPADTSTVGSFTWNPDDHHLGIAELNISVGRINAVDTATTPPTQTATIRIHALLSDNNGDDQWWATVNYNLICLGRRSV